MIVNLRRDFYGPNNVLYLARDNPHDFPTDWEQYLPNGAEIVGRGIVGGEMKKRGRVKRPRVPEAVADDPKVDGLTAGNSPMDATAIVPGTHEDNSQLSSKEADKAKADLAKDAQEGVAATGARPDTQPQVATTRSAKTGSADKPKIDL